MITDDLRLLDDDGLRRLEALVPDALDHLTTRFLDTHGAAYRHLGPDGHAACRDDLQFHLEFLRPVLQFGLVAPMVDYLHWLDSVLQARALPAGALEDSLEALAEYFRDALPRADASIVVAALRGVREEFERKAPGAQSYPLPTPWPEAARLEQLLLAGKQREAFALLDACLDAGQGLVDVELHVMQPALYAIGEKWQHNQVSVAQEHLATAIVHALMSTGLLRTKASARLGRKVLLACVEDNHHALGLHMVADAFHLAGWDTQYLGADVPTPALLDQIGIWAPDLVALSLCFPQQIATARQIITELGKRFGRLRPPVIIGGLAINRFRPLAEVVGADLCSVDASTAVGDATLALRR